MPPKKRKAESIEDLEHPSVFVGRPKILKGPDGEKIVKEYIRNNVILFFRKLKDEEATNYGGKKFQSTLDTEVADALDPARGPQFFTDLTKYGFEDLKLWGNKEASQLISPLLNLVDGNGYQEMLEKLQERLDKETERKGKAENALAYLQALIPVSEEGQKDLAADLEALEQPVKDAAWLYDIMWNSCLMWMDARLRQLRSFSVRIQNGREQTVEKSRAEMINVRMHGGNLRVDALIAALNFGKYRHDDAAYDTYIGQVFQRMYKLSIDDGLWLAKYGNDIARGVDWPHVIGYIDKFVAAWDRILTLPQKKPPNYTDVVDVRYARLTAHVSSLIRQAKADPDWEADDAAIQTMTTLQDDLRTECAKWKAPKETMNVWDKMGDGQPHWKHAEYLRDVPTPKPRTAGPGAAAMILRPLAKVKYTP